MTPMQLIGLCDLPHTQRHAGSNVSQPCQWPLNQGSLTPNPTFLPAPTPVQGTPSIPSTPNHFGIAAQPTPGCHANSTNPLFQHNNPSASHYPPPHSMYQNSQQYTPNHFLSHPHTLIDADTMRCSPEYASLGNIHNSSVSPFAFGNTCANPARQTPSAAEYTCYPSYGSIHPQSYNSSTPEISSCSNVPFGFNNGQYNSTLSPVLPSSSLSSLSCFVAPNQGAASSSLAPLSTFFPSTHSTEHRNNINHPRLSPPQVRAESNSSLQNVQHTDQDQHQDVDLSALENLNVSLTAKTCYSILYPQPRSRYMKTTVSEKFVLSNGCFRACLKTDLDVLCDIYLPFDYQLKNFLALGDMTLTFLINDNVFVSMPLAMLQQLSEYENSASGVFADYIRIPLELLCGELNLSLLQIDSQTKFEIILKFLDLHSVPNLHLNDIFYCGEMVISGKYIYPRRPRLPTTPPVSNIQVFPAMYIKVEIDTEENRIRSDNNSNFPYLNDDENNFNDVNIINSPSVPRHPRNNVLTPPIDSQEDRNITPPWLSQGRTEDPHLLDLYQVTLPLKFKGNCKGLLLLCDNLFDIHCIEIKLNGLSLVKVRKEKMGFLCQKLSNRMIYVPLDSSHDLFSSKIESYDCVLPFGVNSTEAHLVLLAKRLKSITLVACCLTTYQLKNQKIQIDTDISAQASCFLYQPEIGSFLGSRPVDSQRLFCVISQENIRLGECYATCTQCRNNFVNRYLNMYFKINQRSLCPSCRCPWRSDVGFYCNQNESLPWAPFSLEQV